MNGGPLTNLIFDYYQSLREHVIAYLCREMVKYIISN